MEIKRPILIIITWKLKVMLNSIINNDLFIQMYYSPVLIIITIILIYIYCHNIEINIIKPFGLMFMYEV